ncbi:hypothetical protein PHMEG_0002337 [Phytophthora megakarya]|uniref:Uncharacterized protein n=1 Tax=Phytophthora megakarya TaxID=4795 RepID=A0A225WZF2_9STRA|nr:hypothetical protein PHMEG_0002337 [Phytophthora megakarya]
MKTATLLQAFQNVSDVLSSNEGACVVVWPGTTGGSFVGEFQVLTEKEWQRVQRVGLQMAPGVDAMDLYCFKNVPAYDGLTVRVFRLLQGSQIQTRQNEGKLAVWKVQKMPVLIRTRAQVDATARAESESLKNTTEDTPPRPANSVKLRTISYEEMQRKKRGSDDTGQFDDSKCVVDDVRPPMKTRRLSESRMDSRKIATPIKLPEFQTNVAIRERLQHPARTQYSSGNAKGGGFIAVVNCSSSDYSSEAGDDEDSSTSESLYGMENNDESLELNSITTVQSGCNVRLYHETFNSALQKVVATSMCSDEAYPKQVASRSSSTRTLFKPLRSVLASATTRVYKALNTISDLFSLSAVMTVEDYDMLWFEEGDAQQCWTMFGEPSGPDAIDAS